MKPRSLSPERMTQYSERISVRKTNYIFCQQGGTVSESYFSRIAKGKMHLLFMILIFLSMKSRSNCEIMWLDS